MPSIYFRPSALATDRLSKRRVHNPRLQFECATLRRKAMNPDQPFGALSSSEQRALLAQLSPPVDLSEGARYDIVFNFNYKHVKQQSPHK
jgi:hypothetical protein